MVALLAEIAEASFGSPTHTGQCDVVISCAEGKGVNGLANLLDGRIVAAYGDGKLRIWSYIDRDDEDVKDCDLVLKGHTSSVYAVSVLLDGRIVSGSYDNTLRVWSVPAAGSQGQEGVEVECDLVLKGHTNWVRAVSVLLDGRIVSGSRDKTLRVWNLSTGDCDEVYQRDSAPSHLTQLLQNTSSGDNNPSLPFFNDDSCNRMWNITNQDHKLVVAWHDSGVMLFASQLAPRSKHTGLKSRSLKGV